MADAALDIDLIILNQRPAKEIIAELRQQQKQLDQRLINSPEIKRIYILSLPYNELFADVIAVEGWSDRTPHGMFGPVRTYLGKELCWPKTQEERSRKLKKLAEILMKDIKERYEAGATEALPSFNAELIQQLAPVCEAK